MSRQSGADRDATHPSVAVIIPAHNAEATLPACLAAVAAMTVPASEVILFSDGATDRTTAIAEAAGVRVIRHDGPPLGPAHGRNVAAMAARSAVLLFLDADVVIAPDALELLLRDMAGHDAQAAFGSYDDEPRSRRVTSLYANLRHHFIHQHGSRDASTFWSGIGVIGRQTFIAAGGYDAAQFPCPSIEDVELGMRLIDRGARIRLVPEAQGQHCKDWSLWRVWHTDIVRRAYPWSRLLATRQTSRADLNLETAEQWKALVAGASLVMGLCAIFDSRWLIGCAVALGVYLCLSWKIIGFFYSRLGITRASGAVLMHWCYHNYAMLTYAVARLQVASLAWLRPHMIRDRQADAAAVRRIAAPRNDTTARR